LKNAVQNIHFKCDLKKKQKKKKQSVQFPEVLRFTFPKSKIGFPQKTFSILLFVRSPVYYSW